MQYTSAEANKLLRKLNEQKSNLLAKEQQVREFHAAVSEDIESVRPSYDYNAVQAELSRIDQSIRSLKHAINRFNLETPVPGFDMSIDQALIYIPQLTQQKQKLSFMRTMLPKHRAEIGGFAHNGSQNVIDYIYANFDPEQADADYEQISEKLSALQTALDLVNNTVKFEIEL